jgi:LPXTG-motif cell wall-anchored protein
MHTSPQPTSARRANSTSTFILGAAGAAVLSAMMVGGSSAAADEIPASSSAVIEFPPGLTMRTLEALDASSILISGCPAGGAVTVESHLEIPLGNGETSSLPVSVLPALSVPDEGVVAVPLLHFAEFLDVVRPSPRAQLVVAARCDPDGPWGSRKVPLDDSDLGTAPPAQVPAPAPPAAPTPGADGDAAPGENASGAEPADADRSVLPETGVPTGLTGPVGVGVLLTLIGGGIVAVRSRMNPRHRAARG